MRKLTLALSFIITLGLAGLASADTCVERSCVAGQDEQGNDIPGTQEVCCPSPEDLEDLIPGENVCGSIDAADGSVMVAGCTDTDGPEGCIAVGPANTSEAQGGAPGSCEEDAVAACEACGCAEAGECVPN